LEWVSVVVVEVAGAGVVVFSVVVVVLGADASFFSFTVVLQAGSDTRAVTARHEIMNFFIS
jgi:translation initiation factor 2B subunit (eIF-2B alpha/beta/delta family)